VRVKEESQETCPINILMNAFGKKGWIVPKPQTVYRYDYTGGFCAVLFPPPCIDEMYNKGLT